MNFPSISTTRTTFTTSTTSINNQPTTKVSLEQSASTEAFFEAEINGSLHRARNIFYALKSRLYCKNEFPLSLISALETEETRSAALKTVSYVIGKMYRDGTAHLMRTSDELDNPRHDDLEAVSFFQEAAKLGCIHSLEALKNMYLEGRGLWKKDFSSQHVICYLAPSYLAVEILSALSIYHSELPIVTGNEKADAFLMTLFNSKSAQGTYQLGVLYEEIENHAVSEFYMGRAAFTEKYPDAICQFGEWHLAGNHLMEIDRNPIQGETFLRAAAEQGSDRAKILLEKMYLEERGKNAFTYFSQEHEKGIAAATYGLAVLYEKGPGGVTQDLTKAKKLVEEAVRAGSSDALFTLAELSLNHNESLQNCDNNLQTTKYLMQAAINGMLRRLISSV